MFAYVSRRMLAVLQLTRVGLVYTAIADSLCALFLDTHAREPGTWPTVQLVATTVIVSTSLYAFGMSLNDIVDRRRDRQLAAHRPLPSGRIGIRTAHAICVGLALLAAGAGVSLSTLHPAGYQCLAMIAATMTAIVLYDVAGKYLVAGGLITLGLVRFLHAGVAGPSYPVPLHALFLFNHVAALSTFGYIWEQKRPALTGRHVVYVLVGLLGVNAVLSGLLFSGRGVTWLTDLRALYPAACAVAFVALAILLRARATNQRSAGQQLILYGLLWLIVYDAAFAWAYVSVYAGLLILALLPLALVSVQVLRWWSVQQAEPARFRRT